MNKTHQFNVEIIGSLLTSATATGVDAGFAALASATGDRRFERARRSFFQISSPGAPTKNDRAALMEAKSIWEEGRARSVRAALWTVALARHPDNPEAALRRYQYKAKAKKFFA